MSYYNIPLVHLMKNAKILSYMYWNWAQILRAKVGVCATLIIVTAVLVNSVTYHGRIDKGAALWQLHQGNSGHGTSGSPASYSPGLYLFKKPGWWIPALSWSAQDSRAVPFWLGHAPVDGICIHHGEHTAGRALHGVCSVVAGAAGVGVVGATAFGSLIA